MNDLYENIQSLCQEKGIRPGFLCSELGLSRGLMTDLKMGRKKTVSAETAQKIASYLGVTVGYLLGEEDEKEKSPVASDEAVKVALFGGDTEVTEEMWNEVMNYAEYIKQKYRKT